MKSSFKSWSIVLPVSAAVHFAALVGLKPLSEGVQEPPAGAEISVAASLAGIMGQVAKMTEEVTTEEDQSVQPTEMSAVTDATKQTTPLPNQVAAIEPQTVEKVSQKPLQESNIQPTEAKSVAEDTKPVSATVSEAQSATEVPVAALQSATPTPMQDLEAASQVEPTSVAIPTATEAEPVSAHPVDAKPKPVKPKKAKRKKTPKKTKKRAARTPPGNNRRGTAGQQRGGKKGTSRASSGAILSYGARVRARIVGNRPGAAGTGRVVVSFGLSSTGGLRFARIARSSGSSSVDRAALSAVRRSSPFPRPPKGASSGQLRFSIPFHFQ